jgi:hypothetical protein
MTKLTCNCLIALGEPGTCSLICQLLRVVRLAANL